MDHRMPSISQLQVINSLLNERRGIIIASQNPPSIKCRRNIHDIPIQAYPRPDGVVANC